MNLFGFYGFGGFRLAICVRTEPIGSHTSSKFNSKSIAFRTSAWDIFWSFEPFNLDPHVIRVPLHDTAVLADAAREMSRQ
jgi:hypothetical protein